METQIRTEIMNTKNRIRITIAAVCLIIAAECQGAHKQKKQEMQAKWQQATSEIKLSAAQGQFEAGQYEQAEAAAKENIDAGLNLPEANLLLGKVKLAQGDFYGAKSCFETYMRFEQDNAESWFLLAIVCERLGDNNSAFEWYQKALELSPDNTDYIIAVGRMYVAQNEFAMAEEFYHRLISAKPADTDLKIAVAQMYLEWGQNDKAVGLYEQAQLMKPENNELLEALGSCYILVNDWQKAHDIHKQLYQRCQDKTAKNRYLKIMAFTATEAGDYSSAMKYYSQLTMQDKANADFWFSMGQAALGAGSLQQALICSQKALKLKPDMAEAYLLSGSANYKNGSYSQAIDDFQRAAAGSVDAHFAWLMTAKCYEKTGNTAQAEAAHAKAAQLCSDNELQQLLTMELYQEN
jgi:tetratricopeptide (TPR) repeat protein